MRPRATWRARRDDCRTALGWLSRDLGAPFVLVAGRLAWVMKMAALVALFGGRWGPAFLLFTFSTLVDDPSTLIKTLPFAPKALPVGDLLTLPPVTTAYPCRVEVMKGGTLLGRDVGVVTFLDGWLHYEGRRTSFSLRRSDVSRRVEDRLDLSEGGNVAFHPGDLLIAGEHTEAGLAERFRANLKSWMRSDPPEGDSILPPALAHPSGAARAHGALATSLVVGGTATVLAAVALRPLCATFIGLAFGLSLAQAIRDLARIRRTTRGIVE